jgi:hypothetical protein
MLLVKNLNFFIVIQRKEIEPLSRSIRSNGEDFDHNLNLSYRYSIPVLRLLLCISTPGTCVPPDYSDAFSLEQGTLWAFIPKDVSYSQLFRAE